MDELDKNISDDFWRKSFDDASEAPPARVWDAIEYQLDESNRSRIIPLWGLGFATSKHVAWGMGIAAALTLLLVGWWAMQIQWVHTPSSVVAHKQPSRSTKHVAPTQPVSSASSAKESTENNVTTSVEETIASTHKPTTSLQKQAIAPNDQSLIVHAKSSKQLSAQKQAGASSRQAQSILLAGEPQPKIDLEKSAAYNRALARSINVAKQAAPNERIDIAAMPAVSQRNVSDALAASQPAWTPIEQLEGKKLRLRSPGAIQRIVWFQPADLPLEAEFTEQRKTREKWASASVMPGSFNPMVSLGGSNYALYSTTTNSFNSGQSAVESRPNLSMAYQASAGIQLTERWSVESGVGYLAGRSSIETPSQMLQSGLVPGLSTSSSNNLYVDALNNSKSVTSTGVQASPSKDYFANNQTSTKATYLSDNQQTISNDYQYMQVPVQVGYQLRPRKKLGLALIGGFLTNIFIRNTVANNIVITNNDGVYRPISLAATMGARFRYRPSGRWSASLAGIYQPALGLGSQSTSQVQIHPTSAGMSFGVDYHF